MEASRPHAGVSVLSNSQQATAKGQPLNRTPNPNQH
ncbi:hypothetical protein VTH82DRAFT_425 [Thermothelomyces myriococcoides]